MTFEGYLQKKGLIQKTVERHQREVKRYHRFLQDRGIALEQATKKELLLYLDHIREHRRLRPVSVNGILGVLKNYRAYLSEHHGLGNHARNIKIRGVKRKQLRPLFDDGGLAQLCEGYWHFTRSYRPSDRELYRTPDHGALLTASYLALTVMAYQGANVSEVLRLTAADLDWRKGKVTIRAHRRFRQRILKLDVCQMAVGMAYFGQNERLLRHTSQLERLAGQLKQIDTDFLDFRQLRASRIVHWIRVHGLRKAQYMAGHASIDSTQEYLANDCDRLKSELENFHPFSG